MYKKVETYSWVVKWIDMRASRDISRIQYIVVDSQHKYYN